MTLNHNKKLFTRDSNHFKTNQPNFRLAFTSQTKFIFHRPTRFLLYVFQNKVQKTSSSLKIYFSIKKNL